MTESGIDCKVWLFLKTTLWFHATPFKAQTLLSTFIHFHTLLSTLRTESGQDCQVQLFKDKTSAKSLRNLFPNASFSVHLHLYLYFGHGDKRPTKQPSASLLMEHWANQTFSKKIKCSISTFINPLLSTMITGMELSNSTRVGLSGQRGPQLLQESWWRGEALV